LSEKGLADSPVVQSRKLLGEMLHLVATMQMLSRFSEKNRGKKNKDRKFRNNMTMI
jgi:hypothetical protein